MVDIFNGITEIANKLREDLQHRMGRTYGEVAGRDTPVGAVPRAITSAVQQFPHWQTGRGAEGPSAFPAFPQASAAPLPRMSMATSPFPTFRSDGSADELVPRMGRTQTADDLYSYYTNRADAARQRYQDYLTGKGSDSNYNWSGSGDASKADQGRLGGVQQWIPMLQQAAAAEGVPWQALAAIMAIESGGNPNDTSVAGAMGLMQVMPFWFSSGENGRDPWTNIQKGAKVFADAYRRYGSLDKAAAAYLGAIDASGNITGATDAYGTSGFAYVNAFNNYLQAMSFGEGQPSGSTGEPRIDQAVQAAYGAIGTPYVWGGESYAEGGFDCSGLIQYAYAHAGIALPRTAQEQYNATQRIDKSHLRNGDLVFYTNTYDSNLTVTHVGMYINGKVLNAVKEGDVVRWVALDDPWWSAHIYGYGRVPLGGDYTTNHEGVDAPAPAGSRVNNVCAGTVIGTGHDDRLGQYAVVFDGSRFYTYGHLAEIGVREGQHVDKGDSLGTVGSTGLTTGPHTHFEVNDLAGNPQDPWQYLSST